jgi:DNA-binding transcriptional LysR family regulator
MDISELEAFWWIAQTGSFNRAAERLYLTQPSVTARIQSLEKSLGQQLFERRPRGVRLTDAGRVLLPHAERILQDVRRARQAISDLQSATGGTLSLGSALTVSTYTLPEMLQQFKSKYPAVEIAVRTGRSNQIQQLVLEDVVTLGLVHTPLAPHPDIQWITLFDEPIVLVVHPSHPLAREHRISPKQVASEAMITPDRHSGYWSLVERFWASQGLTPRIAMELDSIEATKRMVMSNLGVALLPLATVAQELDMGILRLVPMEGSEAMVRQAVLIHRRGKVWTGITEAFVTVLKDMYGLHGLPDQEPPVDPLAVADEEVSLPSQV